MSHNILDTAVVILKSGDKILVEKFSHKVVIWKVDENDTSTNPDAVTTVDDIGNVFEQLLELGTTVFY